MWRPPALDVTPVPREVAMPAHNGVSDPGAGLASDGAPAPIGVLAEPSELPPAHVDGGQADGGFDAGFEAGARTAREALGADVQTLVDSLACEHERWLQRREQEIVGLAEALAAHLLGRELQHDSEALLARVTQALASLDGGNAPCELALHPLDLASLPALSERHANLAVVADDALPRGDCRVSSGASVIDASAHAWVTALSRAVQP